MKATLMCYYYFAVRVGAAETAKINVKKIELNF
jgi:hypothetical protein